MRTGVSHLLNKDLQLDLGIGGNFKGTPSKYFGSMGVSWRLDFHRDEPIPIEDQDARGDGPIQKNSMKKKKKSDDFGPSKKERRKQKKKNKKRQKELDEIDF